MANADNSSIPYLTHTFNKSNEFHLMFYIWHFVDRKGFEPLTYGLQSHRSSQLS